MKKNVIEIKGTTYFESPIEVRKNNEMILFDKENRMIARTSGIYCIVKPAKDTKINDVKIWAGSLGIHRVIHNSRLERF